MLSYSRDGLGGATIGKRIMGIKVVRATAITHVQNVPGSVIVSPGKDIGFWR